MGKKKAIQEQELKEHEQNSLVLIALDLVLNEMSEKLGCLEWW
jgi:hypothetical protein